MSFVRIKAGALQFVLFIGAVIAVLLLSFVLLNQSHGLFLKKTQRFVALIEKADLGLELALRAENTQQLQNQLIELQPSEITLDVSNSYWGIFESWKVSAAAANNQFTRMALSGYLYPTEVPALYLKDNARPLIIVGQAEISGNVFLPEQGIRPGSISGRSFFGKNLFAGRRFLSAKQMPLLPSEMIESIEKQVNLEPSPSQIPIRSTEKEVKNSFADPVRDLYGEVLVLTGSEFTGNVRVRATRKIIVSPTAVLTDVVLSAPEIEIQAGVQGSFQAFASGQITVGSNVQLNYPSALVVLDNVKPPEGQNQSQRPNISIEKGATVNGIVLYLNAQEGRYYAPQIKIEEGALVRGQVYCDKNIELKGTVHGQVLTDGFIALENGGIYQNHLYDGKILADQLPLEYAGIPATGENNKSTVKWLY